MPLSAGARTLPLVLTYIIAQLFRGFCMGAADVVPGVSGGTVALTFGIYERLIAAVRQGASVLASAVRLDIDRAFDRFRKMDWVFLLPLLAGIGTAIVLLAGAISHLLDEEPEFMAAAFFGLVVASIFIAWEHLKRRDGKSLAVLTGSAVVTFAVLGLKSGTENDPALWFVFVAGAIAICAMILPGISGSFLLLMLGIYDYILDAVDERDLVVLAMFAAGCIIGIASFSTLLSHMLKRHHDTVVAGLIGLMAGSLRVLWPWPGGVDDTSLGNPTWDQVPLAILIALGAGVAAIALTRLSSALSRT